MIDYPVLTEQAQSRKVVDVFQGYDHNIRIADGAFFDMENLTSDGYPVLTQRPGRSIFVEGITPTGMICKDCLCYTDGSKFVMNEYRVEMGLSDEPKQLVSMGAYVIILPDRKYINTEDLSDWGQIDAAWESTANVEFQLCRMDGSVYTDAVIAPEAPAQPANLALWIDTSSTPHTLKQYSAQSGLWVDIATTYVKIVSKGIGRAFEQYDGVEISGVANEQLQDLNATMVIWDKGDDYIVVAGMLDVVANQTVQEGVIRVERRMPEVDFITESGNRLWGCRYGVAANGEIVNEIYASKLGDFKNWNCYMGLSTDSYAASCGTDGQFTGAITHLGYPLFFKEGHLHKVYGSQPSSFQIQATACQGVQKGSHRSLAIISGILYYKSCGGICIYDGSLPQEISYALGAQKFSQAVGGATHSKYYVSMVGEKGRVLFVYDTDRGLWHKEDGLGAEGFCRCGSELYAMTDNSILDLLGGEETVKWMAQTGEIGYFWPDMKYLSRLTVRLAAEQKVRLSICYDQEAKWRLLAEIPGTGLRSVSVPVRPRRCDHFRLRLEGTGQIRVFSMTKTLVQGSEIS